MNRRISLLLISGMLVLAPDLALAAFTDVPDTHEHFAAVQWMEGRNVVKGYEDGTFQPGWEVNRAEALKIILLASEIPVDASIDVSGEAALFPDVKADQWFYPYVKKALQLGVVGGYPDGTFRPGKSINLAEMLKMVYLANQLAPPAVTRSPYPDVDAAVWFSSYAADAKSKNFVAASSDGFLHPEAAVLRGDLTEIMYRFSYVKTFEKEVFPLGLNWPLVQMSGADVAIKVPFDWTITTGDHGELIVWYQDDLYNQTGWGRTTPHSAVVSLFWDPNPQGLSVKAYFDRVRNSLAAYGTVRETNDVAAEGSPSLIMEYASEYENMRDIIVKLPTGFITVQATYGKGRLAEQLGQVIREMQSTVQYRPAPAPPAPERTPEQAVAQARLKIQVDGQGQAMLDLFTDRSLIETDTIGVGTGPVDYYYSSWADVTLKYERSFNVILDLKGGRTTAF